MPLAFCDITMQASWYSEDLTFNVLFKTVTAQHHYLRIKISWKIKLKSLHCTYKFYTYPDID